MIDHKEETPNEGGIVIDLDNQNEFEDNNENEFEDDNDFLVEEQKEETQNIPDEKETVDQQSETTVDSSQALNNDHLINPQNEQMLFEKLGIKNTNLT
jgi:hypothetical protein